MLQENQDVNKNWRKHWLVVNVLNKIAIIGSFSKEETLTKAVHEAGECVASLTSSAIVMTYLMSSDEAENSIASFAENFASMGVAMSTGKIMYTGFYSSGAMLYNYLRSIPSCKNTIENYDAEMQPITAAAPTNILS